MNSNDNKEMVRGRSYQSVCPRIFENPALGFASIRVPDLLQPVPTEEKSQGQANSKLNIYK
jgi:hypothetical protein